jgi:AcrR family transcriptional regulator
MASATGKRPGRDGLLSVATQLFAEQGVSGSSLQQIADAAGVTKAAVYHHFKSKEEIVAAVLEPALDAITAIVRMAGTYSSPTARCEAAIVGLADQAVEHRELWAVLLRDASVETLLNEEQQYAELFASLHRLLAGPRPNKRRPLLVAMFLSGLLAPARDPAAASIADDELRAGIIEAGRRLLLA